MYHEISTAFRARSHRYKEENIQPFHLFIDELSASEVLVDVAPGLASEFRKYGAKGYFVTQSLKALPEDCGERLVGNLSHTFTGYPGGDYWHAPLSDVGAVRLGEFACGVNHRDEGPALFVAKIADLDIWGHLRSGEDISERLAENSGLVGVRERCRHAGVLPERIEQWLCTGMAPTVDEVIESQVRDFQDALSERGGHIKDRATEAYRAHLESASNKVGRGLSGFGKKVSASVVRVARFISGRR